jgi:hypothetical protein
VGGLDGPVAYDCDVHTHIIPGQRRVFGSLGLSKSAMNRIAAGHARTAAIARMNSSHPTTFRPRSAWDCSRGTRARRRCT